MLLAIEPGEYPSDALSASSPGTSSSLGLCRGLSSCPSPPGGSSSGGAAPQEKEDEENDEGADGHDLWLPDEERGVIVRQQKQERVTRSTPSIARGCPVHPKLLTSERRTVKIMEDGHTSTTRENWRNGMGKPDAVKEDWSGGGLVRRSSGYEGFLQKQPTW